MKRMIAAVCAAAGLIAGCGGTSPVDFCNAFEAEVCARYFECYDAATKASAGFMQSFGASQSECKAKLTASQCATVTNDKPCASGMSYHPDKADGCVNDWKKASCSSILAGLQSDNCAAVCS